MCLSRRFRRARDCGAALSCLSSVGGARYRIVCCVCVLVWGKERNGGGDGFFPASTAYLRVLSNRAYSLLGVFQSAFRAVRHIWEEGEKARTRSLVADDGGVPLHRLFLYAGQSSYAALVRLHGRGGARVFRRFVVRFASAGRMYGGYRRSAFFALGESISSCEILA